MIKNNFPARISFRLASRHDSQTIINGPGAEALLGDGDMLVLTATQPVTRVQGALRLGYNKAAKIIERMEREGIVGPANGVKPRQVLIRPAGEMSPVPNV